MLEILESFVIEGEQDINCFSSPSRSVQVYCLSLSCYSVYFLSILLFCLFGYLYLAVLSIWLSLSCCSVYVSKYLISDPCFVTSIYLSLSLLEQKMYFFSSNLSTLSNLSIFPLMFLLNLTVNCVWYKSSSWVFISIFVSMSRSSSLCLQVHLSMFIYLSVCEKCPLH